MREYEVEDEAYPEVLSETEELIDLLGMVVEASSDQLPEELVVRIQTVLSRVDGIYLRSGETGSEDGESTEQLRKERDMYKRKLKLEKRLRDLAVAYIESSGEATERLAQQLEHTLDEHDPPEYEPIIEDREQAKEALESLERTVEDAIDDLDEVGRWDD